MPASWLNWLRFIRWIRQIPSSILLLYIAVGQGIGAGVYTGGRLMQGTLGVAGEIGHTCIDIHGPQCECGSRGCLTHYVSTPAFMLYAEEERSCHSGTQLQPGFSRSELFAALAAGDSAAAAAQFLFSNTGLLDAPKNPMGAAS